MTKAPDYLRHTADGSAVVTLRDGREITLREPTVADELAAKGDAQAREVALIGNLAELSPAEVAAMKSADYRRLQAGLASFFD